MSDEANDWQFALRAQGSGAVLMYRLCKPDGTDYKGYEVAWQDMGTFGKWNDATLVLNRLKGTWLPLAAVSVSEETEP